MPTIGSIRYRSARAARTAARIVDAALGLPRRGGTVEHFAQHPIARHPQGRFAWSAGTVRRDTRGWIYEVGESTAHVLRRRAIVMGDPLPSWVWETLPRSHPTPSRFGSFALDVFRTVLHGLEPSLAWRTEACAIERTRSGKTWSVWSSVAGDQERTVRELGDALGLFGVPDGRANVSPTDLLDLMRVVETKARPTGRHGEALRWRAFPALLRGPHHEGWVFIGLPTEALRGPDHVRGRGDLDWAFSSFVEAGAFLCGVNLARRLPTVQPISPDDLDALAPNARVAQLYLAGLVAPLAENFPTHRLFDSLGAIAARPYEGREASGRIVLASRDAPGIKNRVVFREHARLEDSKLVRKLLEVAKGRHALLSDGEIVHALVELDAGDLPAGESFIIEFDGRDAWNLVAPGRNKPMMVVHRGIARAPRDGQTPALAAALRRVFSADRDAVKRFDSIIAAMRFAKHGALLVIDSDARQQASPEGRPSGEPPLTAALRTEEPVVLSRELTEALSEIDGAMLVDAECRLHAAGVILDGDESDWSDEPELSRARGARYRSAWRYASKRLRQGASVVIVIVSQDGDVDVVT